MTKPRQFQPMFNGMLGLKQGYAITNMPPGSCLDIKNMYLNGIGGKTPRNGYTELFHTTNGVSGARLTDRIRSLLYYAPFGDTAQVLAFAGTRIFKKNGTTTDVIRSGLASSVPWEWLQYSDFVLGVNGSDSSFLYDGSTYVKISITPPASGIGTATDGGGGALDAGNYYYLDTYYDSTKARESNPVAGAPVLSFAKKVVVGATGKVTLGTFTTPTAGEGIDKRRIYRLRLSETVFTLIAEIPIGDATYVDNDNTNHTTQLEYDNGQQDHGFTPHPNSKLIAQCFDRIFMVDEANPSTLVYSQVGKYWAFPVANFYFVGRGDGSRIVGIRRHGSSLLIEKTNGWYILDSDPAPASTSTPGGVIRLLSYIGSQDFRTTVSAHNQVVRLTTTGFYRCVPTDFNVNDLREDYIGFDVKDNEAQVDYNNSANASMYNYNASNRRHVYFIEPLSASYMSKCLVYDIVLNQWFYYEIGTDVYCVADYFASGVKFAIMGDGYGVVWQWDQGSSDGSSLTSALLNGQATSATGTTLTNTNVCDVVSTATGPGSGADTLADTTQTWTLNQWINKPVYIVSGTGSGQTNTVSTNTANELTLTNPVGSPNWLLAPDNTSVYTIGGWVPDQLIGTVIATWEGTGGSQRRRVTGNTSYTVTIDTAWGTTPDSSTTYTIAGIEKFAEEYWDSSGDPHLWKRMRWIVPYIRQSGDYNVELTFRKDFRSATDLQQNLTINLTSSNSLWGVFLGGVDKWGSETSSLKRLRLHGKYHFYTIKYSNRFAAQPFFWDGHGAVFQVLYDRNK